MSDIPEISISKQDEWKPDLNKHKSYRVITFPAHYLDEEKARINKFIDAIIDKSISETAWDIIWWVLTHPVQDLKIIYYVITVIGVFMNNFLESWRTSIPSILLLITSALAAIGLSLPTDFANIVSMTLIGLILLFTDWKEFTKNLKVYITGIITVIFWILTATHVIILAPVLVTVIIQIVIAIIGMFVAKDQGITNVVKYSGK